MTAQVRRPGWYRAAFFMTVAASFSVGISWLVRMLYGHGTYTHFLEAESFVLIGMFALPIAFLIGVRFGPIGMAGAWVATMPLLLLISTSLSLPVIGLSWRRMVSTILPSLGAAIAMAAIVTLLDRLLPDMLTPPLRLAILVPAGVIAYAGLAMLLARDLVRQAIGMVRGKTGA